MLGGGSSLVGGTLKTEITREEVLELALDGFLPVCELTDKPQEDASSPYREMGLPLVADPAVTRHLAAFLESAGNIRPDAILFNGGFFIPEVLRQRVADVMEHWYGHRPAIFENRDLDLAVAVGAAYYSYVRSTGAGLLVRGGLPRAYFIGLAGTDGDALRAMCLAPRGTEEGSSIELDPGNLQLVANKPVAFRLYSSRTRTEDKAGEVVTFSPEEQSGTASACSPPRCLAIRQGGRASGADQARGEAHRSGDARDLGGVEDVGTSLAAAVRAAQSGRGPRLAETGGGDQRRSAALRRGAYPASVCHRRNAARAASRPARTDAGLGRNSWPVSAIRTLADRMLELVDGRSKSAAHELRWLNLCGFCLRPGFGFPGDDFRIEQARRVYASGLQFSNQIQNEIEWWIFWGRVAGGLNKNQQTDMFQRLSPVLLPRGSKRPRVNASLLREMWRAAASLELLPIQTKTQLGDELMTRVLERRLRRHRPVVHRTIGRAEAVLRPDQSGACRPQSLRAGWSSSSKFLKASDAIGALARHTGDATRDLPATTLSVVRRTFPDLELDREPQDHLAAMGRIFGEDLPSGLVFHE